MTHSQNINLKKLMHESKGKHGQSIFDQITNLLSFIDNNAKNGDMNEIESVSYFLSSTKFQYQKYETAQEVNNKKAHDEFGLKAYHNRLGNLINVTGG
jgi:hypothetical protein